MSQASDSSENEGLGACSPEPQAPGKPDRRFLWAWIVGGAALLAALALILVFVLIPAESPAGSDSASSAGFTPLLYKDGSSVYLAAGSQGIKLDGAAGDYGFRGEVSDDGNTLYYLANLNSSFEGDLMRIALGVKGAKPERIAKNVASAKISPNGDSIVYITNTDYSGIIGSLYICPPGGTPAKIADLVSGLNYGFSSDGSYVYYHTYDTNTYINKLYLYSGGESKEIFESDKMSQVYVDRDGRALIITGDYGFVEKLDYEVYLYDGGEAKLIAEHATFVRSLGRADEVLYVTPDNELVFYNRGDEQMISDKTSGLDFMNNMWLKIADERFVFAEGGEDASVLYEFTLPDGKAIIGNTNLRYFANADFSRVAYYKQDGLYIAAEKDGKWNETKVAGRGGEPQFDRGGNYIYYINSPDNTRENNTLYRMSLSTGETETLFAGVEEFLLWNNECYVQSTEGDLYLIRGMNDSVLIQKGFAQEHFNDTPLHLSGLIAAKEGVYAFNYKNGSWPEFTEIYYISGEKAVRVCGEVEYLECMGLMPLIVY